MYLHFLFMKDMDNARLQEEQEFRKKQEALFLNSLMQDDREWLMKMFSHCSGVQIKAVKTCEATHHHAIKD